MHVRIWNLALTLVAALPLLGCGAAKPLCADDRPQPPALTACAAGPIVEEPSIGPDGPDGPEYRIEGIVEEIGTGGTEECFGA